jgi:hypothetical protein
MRRALRIAIVIAAEVAVVTVAFELSLRVLYPFNDNLRILLYMPRIQTEFDGIKTLEGLLNHSVIGFRPGRVHSGFVLNSRGLRTREYATRKRPGTLRVVALGDSFTFASGGMPYSELWPSLLEGHLRERGSRPVEVLSLGVPGVGPSFLKRLWELEGSRLRPDVVILALFVGNDFTDEGPAVVENLGTSLARVSYAARLVRNVLRLWRAGVELPAEGAPAPASGPRSGGYEIPGYRESFARRRPKLSDRALLEMETERSAICERATSESFEALFAKTAKVIASLHDEVRASGAEFLLVVIPDRFQVNPDERRRIVESEGRSDSEFDWDRPQRRLDGLCREAGLDCLDLLPAFRREATSVALYNAGDAHWSEAGNRLAAQEIAAHLAPAVAGTTSGP